MRIFLRDFFLRLNKIEPSEVLVLLLVQIFIVSLIAAGIFWLLENY